jgi:nicotinate phosphoribosyltransferase
MAHSFVQAHDDEAQAFVDFASALPDNVVLLIDTYDTLAGARKAVAVAERLAQRGIRIRGVRLDSGDLATLAREVRAELDRGGVSDATIFASGNLDEFRVRDLVAGGAPIDGFGVGTSLVTSSDVPYLDAVYKLQEYGGRPRRKRSTGKATWPGRKQVYRQSGADGTIAEDVVTLEDDPREGEPLLAPVMEHGRRIAASSDLAAIRMHAARELARLPAALRALDGAETPYPVRIAPPLAAMADAVDRATQAVQDGEGR